MGSTLDEALRSTSRDGGAATRPGEARATSLASSDATVLAEPRDAGRPRASARSTALDGAPSGEDEAALDDEEALRPGATIDRYEVAGLLGAGGMGAVYRARDPELDRWLAIKVLRRGRQGARDEARFLREAQAMARLSHPNVVPVHDVGASRYGPFLAMELVEGVTLRRWLDEAPRGWREVVELFAQAGHGLAEAHAAGIVHRDFKPENVLVDRRGRARVTDFGLARPEVEARPAAGAAIGESALTRSGTIMGTPAYMAPEQLAGRKVDARADVFAFCVALHEAALGGQPFGGATIGERLARITAGQRERARGGAAPRWLARAIDRGLAADPEARWAGMTPLLAALERGLGRRRRAGWLAAATLPAAALVGAVMASRPEPPSCAAEEALAGVWGEAESAAVAAAIRGTGLAFAEDTWLKVQVLVDSYAEAWVDLRERSCAEHRGGAISSDLLDRRALCLDRRRADLALVLAALRAGERGAVERAVDLIGGLEAVASCLDPARPAGGERAGNPGFAAWAEDVRVRLMEVRVHERSGALAAARARAEAIAAEAEALGEEAPRLEALYLRARALAGLGEHEAAERDLVAVLEGAHARGLDALATQAAAFLIFVSGEARARYAVGEAWARLALAGARRIGDDGREEATARHYYGVMLSSADRVEEALAELEQAYALRLRLLGADHVETSGSATSLGNVLWKAGRLEEAVTLQQKSLASREAALGPNHPALVIPLGNLGVALVALERAPEARAAWTRALALLRANFPESHPNVAVISANLADLDAQAGDHAAAREHYEAALAGARVSLGEHPDTALILTGLASARIALGELDLAEAALVEAAAMTARTVGAEHSNAAAIRLTTARLRRAQGRAEAAREEAAAARAIAERAFGPEHPRVAEALLAAADAALALGRPAEAIADLERARAIAEASESPLMGARALLALARALEGSGGDRAAAARHRARAMELAEEAGSAGAELRAELAATVGSGPRADSAPGAGEAGGGLRSGH